MKNRWAALGLPALGCSGGSLGSGGTGGTSGVLTGEGPGCHNSIVLPSTGACCGISELGVAGWGLPLGHTRRRTGTCP